jgi:P-type conjugative transfer protein TrbJ
MKTRLLALAASAALVGGWSWATMWPEPARAMPVYDSANYAQNLVQAARSLEQINNQIRSLQNEASMLANMGKNLKTIPFEELGALTDKLQSIDKLMGKAQGIGFKAQELDREFAALFPKDPGDWKTGRMVGDARSRLDTALAAFKHSMGVQAQVIENVQADAATLRAIAGKSQNAQGSLAAQQATNQLLALAAKQQLQLQSLLASQFRGQAVEEARRIRSEEDARSATRRFLGSGKAYHVPE